MAFAIIVGAAVRVLPALLAVPIQRDLGWRISDVVWPITLGMAISGLAAPLAAQGLERFGVRWLLFASLVLLAASLAMTTVATSPVHLVLTWGVGLGFSGSVSAALLGAINGSRGDAAHCGARFGSLTSMQFLGSTAGLLLASRAADALGWRVVFHAAAAAALIAAFSSAALVRTSRHTATEPGSASGRYKPSCPAVGSQQFWVFVAIFLICGASTSGLIDGRLGILCMGAGLGLSSSADVQALVLFAGAIGSAASGYLADRYPARALLVIYFVARAIVLLWLPFSDLNVVELGRFGALYGLDAALTSPALVKLMSESLGRRGLATTMGWMTAAHVAGATVTSASVGALGLAAYAIGFAGAGLLCLLAAGLVALLKVAPANRPLSR